VLRGAQAVHTVDLYDIDDCLEIAEVDGQHVHLEPTMEQAPLELNNGWRSSRARRSKCSPLELEQ